MEDHSESRDLLTSLLTIAGAECRAVATANEALAELKRFGPEAIISDVDLQGEDGYTLARKVRRLCPEEGGRTPAIALTAYGQAEDRVHALDAGFQMHLRKPVEPSELIAAVASLVQRRPEGDQGGQGERSH